MTSATIHLHLGKGDIDRCKVTFTDASIPVTAVDIDQTTIFFRTVAQLDQLIDTLTEAKHKLSDVSK